MFGEAEISGLEALLASGVGQANLMGQIGTGLLTQAMQPTFVGGTGGAAGGSGGGTLGTGKSFSEFLDDVIGLDPSGGGLFRIFG